MLDNVMEYRDSDNVNWNDRLMIWIDGHVNQRTDRQTLMIRIKLSDRHWWCEAKTKQTLMMWISKDRTQTDTDDVNIERPNRHWWCEYWKTKHKQTLMMWISKDQTQTDTDEVNIERPNTKRHWWCEYPKTKQTLMMWIETPDFQLSCESYRQRVLMWF